MSPEDFHHVACLRVPWSFYDQLPPGYWAHLSERMAHHQYMMLHIVYQLKQEFTMPPRDNEETQPNQSVSTWYGKIKPRVCTLDPTPQVLQQQVMYTPRAKVKAPSTAA